MKISREAKRAFIKNIRNAFSGAVAGADGDTRHLFLGMREKADDICDRLQRSRRHDNLSQALEALDDMLFEYDPHVDKTASPQAGELFAGLCLVVFNMATRAPVKKPQKPDPDPTLLLGLSKTQEARLLWQRGAHAKPLDC